MKQLITIETHQFIKVNKLMSFLFTKPSSYLASNLLRLIKVKIKTIIAITIDVKPK